MSDPHGVLVVDDHTLVRTGVVNIIAHEPDLRVVAEASNGAEAVDAYAKHRPDVTLLDLRMPVMEGVEAVRQIRALDPNAKVILSNASNLPPASYSTAQATRGKDIYEGTCGTCHQPAQFIGQTFVESWNDRRVWDFYSLVRSTMPLDNPGGMKDQEYIDVVAYLLQVNKAPAGTDSLKADTTALRAHKIAVHFP